MQLKRKEMWHANTNQLYFGMTTRILMWKGTLDVRVKLFPCDLMITSSSYENNLLQYRLKLHTIDLSPKHRIDRNFMHRTAL